MRSLRPLLWLSLCLPALSVAQQTVTVDFESLTEGQAAASLVPGYTFTNALVLQSGASLNEIEFPPKSGTKVVADVGGPMVIKFTNPVTKFTGYFTHSQAVTIRGLARGGGLAGPVV